LLPQIDRQAPKGKALHLIADNYATHKHPTVQAWLDKHPRLHMHFTPTSASWLNMVERLLRHINTERLRRGMFASVPELVAAPSMNTSCITTSIPSRSSGSRALATSCKRSFAPIAA
jgi:hypothetical protein